VQGRRGGILRYQKLLQLRIVGLQETAPLAGDLDAAGDEVGLDRADEAVALGAGDAAGLFEFVQRLVKGAFVPGRQLEAAHQFHGFKRHVIPPAQQFQNIFFHHGFSLRRIRLAFLVACLSR
jgi:hypothetical protein